MAVAEKRTKVNVNALRVRDYRMVRLICGETKAAVHVDRRKEAKRLACRRPRDDGEER